MANMSSTSSGKIMSILSYTILVVTVAISSWINVVYFQRLKSSIGELRKESALRWKHFLDQGGSEVDDEDEDDEYEEDEEDEEYEEEEEEDEDENDENDENQEPPDWSAMRVDGSPLSTVVEVGETDDTTPLEDQHKSVKNSKKRNKKWWEEKGGDVIEEKKEAS